MSGLKKTGSPAALEDDGKIVRLRADRLGRPVLDQFSEEGFVDSVFRIERLTRDRRQYRFHLAASSGRAVLGFDCRVVRGVKAGFDADMRIEPRHFYRDGVEFRRSGPESDRFLRVMARRFGYRRPAARMASGVAFTGLALHQGALDLEREPVKIKLFGYERPSDDPEMYNESFFNLDLRSGLVFWNEKDPEYRPALLSALTADSRD